MQKKYRWLFFLLILICSSCSNHQEFNFSDNSNFEKKFGNQVELINSERNFQQNSSSNNSDTLDPTNAVNLNIPIFQNENNDDKSNSFNYVDISHFGMAQPRQYFPNYETYQQGARNNPNSNLSPRIFEISYNTYLNQPFDESGKDFDMIDIPEIDSYGVRSSSNNKNYNLVPIKSLQNAVKTINDSKTIDDIEFSKKIIVEKKVLLRRKKLDRFQEKNQYVKFFQDSSSQAKFDSNEDDLLNQKITNN